MAGRQRARDDSKRLLPRVRQTKCEEANDTDIMSSVAASAPPPLGGPTLRPTARCAAGRASICSYTNTRPAGRASSSSARTRIDAGNSQGRLRRGTPLRAQANGPQASETLTSQAAEKRAWKDYFGNFVRAPIGYKSFLIDDPRQEELGPRDPERWVKFTPEIGPVGERKPLPHAFKRILNAPSNLVTVKMPRPMGIVFEMDRQGYTRVVEIVRNSKAEQQSSVARLGAGLENGGFPVVGDVLRAVTATTLEWGGRTELTGDLSGSQRRVVLFGADGQSWEAVQGALRSGLVADGDVELVLERPSRESPASEWMMSTDEELDALAARNEEQMLAEIPGTLNEAQSFNIAVFGVVATTVGLFLAGFS